VPEVLSALRGIGVEIEMGDIFIEGPRTDPASHLCLPLIARSSEVANRGGQSMWSLRPNVVG
jgi:hypothetical protein